MATKCASSLDAVTIDTGTPNDSEFTISRVFDAPRELVYEAWVNPKHLAAWWGPKMFTNPICEIDAKVGGGFRLVMRGPKGDEYPMSGVFHELTPPGRIVATFDTSQHGEAWHRLVQPDAKVLDPHASDSLVTMTFANEAGKTRMTVNMKFKTPAIRDAMTRVGMGEGWTSSFEKMDELFASVGKAVVKE
jgi:uncharacterized protein YndB with AHSA1/START domain